METIEEYMAREPEDKSTDKSQELVRSYYSIADGVEARYGGEKPTDPEELEEYTDSCDRMDAIVTEITALGLTMKEASGRAWND